MTIQRFAVGQKVKVVDVGGNPRLMIGQTLTISGATLIDPIKIDGITHGQQEWMYSFVEPYGSLFEKRLELEI